MKKTITITKKVNVPLSIAYKVVAEVEHYPEFVPNVRAVEVLAQNDDRMIAEMSFNSNLLNVRIQSLVTFHKNQSIIIEQLNGHFKSFQQNWRFEKVETGTLISVSYELEFNNLISGMLALKKLKKSTPEILNAFIIRAEQKMNASK